MRSDEAKKRKQYTPNVITQFDLSCRVNADEFELKGLKEDTVYSIPTIYRPTTHPLSKVIRRLYCVRLPNPRR